MFESMPLNPGTLNACTRCDQADECRAAAGITPERAAERLATQKIMHAGTRSASKRIAPMRFPKKVKQEGGKVGMKCKKDGCEKFVVEEGMCSTCFKEEHGMTVGKARRLKAAHPDIQTPGATEEPAPAPERVPATLHFPAGTAMPTFTGKMTFDVVDWPIDKVVALQELVNGSLAG